MSGARIAALADLHLGFRRGTRTVDGRNLGELDVEAAFKQAVRDIIAWKPDAVTIAGDTFHHLRVSDFARLTLIEAMVRFQGEGIPVILLQGNHEASRTGDALTPIALPGHLDNVYVVTEPTRVHITTRAGVDVAFACFPFTVRQSDPKTYSLDPDPDADVNVIVIHAAVRTSDRDVEELPWFYVGGHALDIGHEAQRWDGICVGDYHDFRPLHGTRPAFYSGSIERTSSNIWQEAGEKGWVALDTATGEYELRPVATRPMFDLQMEDGVGLEEVNEGLARIAADDLYRDALVRLKVVDFPKDQRRHIAWGLVGNLKRSCALFHFDVRYARSEVGGLGDLRAREGKVLDMAAEAVVFLAYEDEEVRDLFLVYLNASADAEGVMESDYAPEGEV